eukprot:TRINITY_DN13141_c0_g1_i1.p1 TRINITY_DN13141_c0_g1~~TRINITY_DN13141_c0_g1_i1.p1  ORF type:complete len:699 (-),score=148.09 TRINITY_DN13141_c0_g1_i1:28-1887(-)
MTHDNTAAVMKKFLQLGPGISILNPRQPVFALDHNVQDTSPQNLQKYEEIKKFAMDQGVDFFPAGRGIGHQIMCEEGYAFPGTLAVGSDSHSNMYGGLGCLGTPVVRTDAAGIWATSKTWWSVPPIAKVEFHGNLKPGVTGKDVIIALCGIFNKDEVLNHAVEFSGPGVADLNIESRLTIANMTTEWGAVAGVFPIDRKTLDWFKERKEELGNRGIRDHPRFNDSSISRLRTNFGEFAPDPDATYAKVLKLNLNSVSPHVSGPDHVKVMQSLFEIQQKNIKIHKGYIVSCVNGRLGDLERAASVLRGKKIAEGVELYIGAASSEVESLARSLGYWQILLDSGARALPPGCGPCIGLGTGTLRDGEVGISATNRNFKGRMGSRNAQCYLASPEVVASSCVEGYIAGPFPSSAVSLDYSIQVNQIPKRSPSEKQTLAEGFPKTIFGPLVFCHEDNLNTDGIYPSKYTYDERISNERQAEVVMENYDPKFVSMVREGDILVGGFNFGTGSSREQAVTALKYKGVRLVLAGSFSETYKRNAINNGYLCLESPDLVLRLKKELGSLQPTVRIPDVQISVDFVNNCVKYGDSEYGIPSVGEIVQKLVLAGGSEGWVKEELASSNN